MSQLKTASASSSVIAMAAAMCAGSFTTGAFAQSGASDSSRDVITVTAQRRAENLQDVPVAVTALDTEDLEARQIRDINDLQAHIPNSVISTGTGTANSARIYFRGIGEDESRGPIDPAVGIYVDGVYLGRTVGSLVDLVDLEQVEVLRGPQGTLYGRNTNGGAIRIMSVAPQIGENSLDLDFGTGSDSRVSGRFTGNLALGDSTAFRISSLYKYRDGFFEVLPNGPFAPLADDNAGLEQVFAMRGSLLHEFNADWSVQITGDYTDDNSDPTPSSIIHESDDPSVVTDADGDLFTIEPAPGTTCASIFQVGCFTGFDSEVESFGVSVRIDGALGDNFNVTSISAYRTLDDMLNTHITFPYSQTTDQEQFSQEVTLTSNFDGPFNFVSGVYYYNEDVQLDTLFAGIDAAMLIDTSSFAVFGQGAFEITDRLTLTGGLRYTTETRDFVGDTMFAFVQTVVPVTASLESDNVTYTAKLDYALTDDVMVYGSYSTGFKTPGFSPDCFSAAACFRSVNEEDLDSFEVGLRSELADGAVIFNATYFYNNYTDLQISGTLPTGGFTRINADKARIQGVEVETSWFPVEGLDIYAHASWLDGEYQDLSATNAGLLTGSRTSPSVIPGAACSNVTETMAGPALDQQLIDCALGLELKNAPEFKALVGFVYSTPMAGGAVSFGGDLAYENDSFALVANNPGSLSQPGVRINARIAYAPDDGRWRLAFWGKNLTDQQYFQATTGANNVYASPPLTWGVDMGVSF